MTSTLSPSDTGDIRLGEGTRDLTCLTQRPALRRADASGEFPFYQPQTIGDVDVMARAALEATLVHAFPLPPLDSLPEAVRRPAASLHRAEVPPPRRRPLFYRGLRRMVEPPRTASPRWTRDAVLHGSGMIHAAVWLLIGAYVLAAIR